MSIVRRGRIALGSLFCGACFGTMSVTPDYSIAPRPEESLCQRDLRYLVEGLRDAHPIGASWLSREDVADQQASTLRALIDCEDTIDLAPHAQRLLAGLEDSHTYVVGLHDARAQLAVAFRQDGAMLRIVAAPESVDRAMLGAQVLSISKRPAMELFEEAAELASAASEAHRIALAERMLARPPALRWLGIESDDGLVVETTAGRFTVETEWEDGVAVLRPPHPISHPRPENFWYTPLEHEPYAYLQLNSMLDYDVMADVLDDHLHPILMPVARAGLLTFGRQRGFHLRASEFYARCFADMRERGIRGLVVDVRNNAGGNLEVGTQLLAHLGHRRLPVIRRIQVQMSTLFRESRPGMSKQLDEIQIARSGGPLPDGLFRVVDFREIYGEKTSELAPLSDAPNHYANVPVEEPYPIPVAVLIGRDSISAASSFAIVANTLGLPTFGEPTGERFDGYGGALDVLRLPHTGLMVNLATSLNDPLQEREHCCPPARYPAPMSFDDFRSGRDPALARALDWLRAQATGV